MTALSAALVRANKSKLSARAVARLAQEQGHTLNHDTAARYLRGDHGTPDEATLLAFSEVLGVSLRTLRTAANLPADITAPYTPPPEASRLTRRQRRAVDEIIRAMLEPSSSKAAPAAPVATVSPLPAKAGRTRVTGRGSATRSTGTARTGRRAARHGDPEAPARD